MNAFLSCTCPYCGERIDLPTDASAEIQDYVEDCPVCCRPIQVRAEVDPQGETSLLLARDDEA
ncbi:MAG TPA: CPXCG motif-containing cysteine-rich protein [Xanthomonadaceae bacterium]|nr:CPXCG motif-containing cysteine-rich protein [Xanthomonadaceae bacterium]